MVRQRKNLLNRFIIVRYWVNYDIDVPLFLPVYADSRLLTLPDLNLFRLYDLRKVAKAEVAQGSRMLGQVMSIPFV